MNRRAHARYAIRLSAELRADGRAFTGTTKNVSAGGFCVEAAYPLREQTEVAVDLFLVIDDVEYEQMPPLEARARVQWAAETDTGEHAAGLQFVGLSQAQADWLAAFLARVGQD
jgi:hypothetical protein